ncbi:MAG: thioredoxin family protein [Treponema sp.]|nr:thioredoxin family protein [Treponema sp.]
MKKNIGLLFVLLFTAFTLISCGEKPVLDECGCYSSFEQAKKEAAKQKKAMLLIVTSDGDDEVSTAFVQNVLKNESFRERSEKDFILCHLDFSEKSYQKTVIKDDASEEEIKAADAFSEMMQKNFVFVQNIGLEYVPAVFLMTKEAFIVNEIFIENDECTADKFFAELIGYQQQFDDFEVMVKETTKGSKLERLQAMDNIYDTTPDRYKVSLESMWKSAVKLDKKNKTGLASKYIYMDADEKAAELFYKQDVEGAMNVYLKMIDSKVLNPEDNQKAYSMCAYILQASGSSDVTAMLSYYQKAIDAAPESEFAPNLRQVMEYISQATVTAPLTDSDFEDSEPASME